MSELQSILTNHQNGCYFSIYKNTNIYNNPPPPKTASLIENVSKKKLLANASLNGSVTDIMCLDKAYDPDL